MIDPIVLRTKLRNGETIDSVCKEYDLTFHNLFELLKRSEEEIPGRRPKHSTGELYISSRDGGYFVRKNDVYYGNYSSLEDAKKVRDYFILNGWDKRKLDVVCRKVGVKRVTRG